MGMSDLQFNLLYSVYSFPNVILPLLGGFFIDKIGRRYLPLSAYCYDPRPSLMLFVTLVTVGQFIFAMSTGAVCWWSTPAGGQALMIFSRVFFGLGGESLGVAVDIFLSQWFQGRELSFAMSACISMTRLADTSNDMLTPRIYDAHGKRLGYGYWVGFCFCVFALVCAAALSWMDRRTDKEGALIEASTSPGEGEEASEINISDVKKLPKPFWLITANCVFFYMSYISLLNVISGLMQSRFGLSAERAGIYMVLSPI